MRSAALALWVAILGLDGVLHTRAASSSTKGGSRSCSGSFDMPVVNLCPSHFPDARAEKVWLVLFYAPWCGHCKALEPKFKELGNLLKDEKGIGIGAIDCTDTANQALCSKYEVKGYPTIKALVQGKPQAYNGARETEPMRAWITKVFARRGTAGGSAKCPDGVFKSKVTDSVVSLCEAHFPGPEAKSAWLVAFYDSKSDESADMRRDLNALADEYGNQPGDREASFKSRQKLRDRIQGVASKYQIDLKLPKKGPFGFGPIAKVGAVCCDCEGGDSAGYCRDLLDKEHGDVQLPVLAWVEGGSLQLQKKAITVPGAVRYTLNMMGYLAPGGKHSDWTEL